MPGPEDVSEEASDGTEIFQLQVAFLWHSHGCYSSIPGTTDILWPDFFPTLQMFCG